MLWATLGYVFLVLGADNPKTASGVVQGRELLRNPTFANAAKDWILREATSLKAIGHGQSQSVQLAGVEPGPQSWSHVGAVIKPAPGDCELHFSCFVKARTKGQSITVNAFGYGAERAATFQHSSFLALADGEWKKFTAEYVVPAGTQELAIWVINGTDKPVIVSDAHLLTGKPKKAERDESLGRLAAAPKALKGPGIVRATACAAVCTRGKRDQGVVTFPVPATYRSQVPLTFVVKTEPPSALQSYRWVDRPDGRNRLCEVTVAPTAKGAVVSWEALVLVDREEPAPLPHADKPDVPDEAKPWTRSTACVQSDDPAIQAKAKELAQDAADIEAFARKVMAFTSRNSGKPGVAFDALDAKKALDCGGSCTSRANLAAALLRARGIPARTLAHLPTWVPGLYEHWLVEYWHPGRGWVWLESTRAEFQPQPYTLVVLNVANPDDEDQAYDPIQLRHVMPGAPHWAVHTTSVELFPARALSRSLFRA